METEQIMTAKGGPSLEHANLLEWRVRKAKVRGHKRDVNRILALRPRQRHQVSL